jgi:hypothetical protein
MILTVPSSISSMIATGCGGVTGLGPALWRLEHERQVGLPPHGGPSAMQAVVLAVGELAGGHGQAVGDRCRPELFRWVAP